MARVYQHGGPIAGTHARVAESEKIPGKFDVVMRYSLTSPGSHVVKSSGAGQSAKDVQGLSLEDACKRLQLVDKSLVAILGSKRTKGLRRG